ncbi:MAG: DUF4399 domain-containing protein [Chloroflexi bacterium]|nr:DUF4399 domain-containing protein [Chloroflexota bacterium]
MLRIAAALGLLLSLAVTSTALAQQAPQIVITSPANGATVPGPDVTVTIQVSGTTLVPAASATKLEDLHVHYMLDTDAAPYLSGTTPIPAGDPNIVHAGAPSNTFAGVAQGEHRFSVVLGLSDHRAFQPPVAPAVTFTVVRQPSAPAQLPRTGDANTAERPLLVAGGLTALLGLVLLGLARSGLGHRR